MSLASRKSSLIFNGNIYRDVDRDAMDLALGQTY